MFRRLSARSVLAAVSFVLLGAGCGRSTLDLFVGPGFDGGLDADVAEAGLDGDVVSDAGSAMDAGPPWDSGPDGGFEEDGGSPDDGGTDAEVDGGPTDGGPSDGGPTDGGPSDGGPTDGGPSDGGPTDGGPSDGGPTDGGPTDGGPSDGGSDASVGCLSNADCNDGNPCTVGTCQLGTGVCTQAIRDQDGDGYPDALCGGNDCDDLRRTVNPGQTEQCRNGRDDNCNGLVDCADPSCAARQVCSICFPFEICGFGFDFDCDGLVDCADPDCAAFPNCLTGP